VGERAVSYRRLNHIPDDWGTAVNVQQMVFGNKGDTSGSGVAFSRDEVTGAPEPSGDFLPNAQGEDVVSGVRTPRDIADMREWMPEAHEQLMEILRTLEAHYQDMQDTEFTVEEGQLYMLQTRNAKRPAQAAVRFAVDAVNENLLTRDRALLTIDPDTLDALLHPTFDPQAQYEVLASGVSASPGAAKGEIVFTAADAVAAAEDGRDVILVRPFTDAEDVAGFHAAKGILTSEGGKASHAALVARGMGRPAVVGAQALEIDLTAKTVSVNGVGGVRLHEGDQIAIDGTKGQVTTDDVPLVDAQVNENFQQVLEWADEVRRMNVRTNADTPEDAVKARELGAEGIGLCRTEHMFMAEDRQPKMRAMIMADDRDSRRAALAELLPLQQEDFEGIFKAMAGLPVTIRLLDPPLHEFLPNAEDLAAAVERARIEDAHDLPQLERLLERVHDISEENPMLGTRGVRLGILYPEIYEMQVHAILRAAKAAEQPPHPEIMIPLIDYEHELEIMRELVKAVGDEEGLEIGTDYTVGTMIELPRACFVADRIARFADFFSFGTNDLTQTALGFSRDDVESKFVPTYLKRSIIDRSPFETIDKPGVGWLVRLGAWVGREAHPGLKLGICGEHGGDPESVVFFHRAGLDYVSCSPYRVPVARIAAAQASIEYPIGRWD
jgi:pyruvate,orthophosphate dikinase